MSLVQSFPESNTPTAVAGSEQVRNEVRTPRSADFLYLMGAARVAWPIKTAQTMAHIAGVSRRTCEYWLALEHMPSGLPALRLIAAVRAQLEVRLRTLDEIGKWLR